MAFVCLSRGCHKNRCFTGIDGILFTLSLGFLVFNYYLLDFSLHNKKSINTWHYICMKNDIKMSASLWQSNTLKAIIFKWFLVFSTHSLAFSLCLCIKRTNLKDLFMSRLLIQWTNSKVFSLFFGSKICFKTCILIDNTLSKLSSLSSGNYFSINV